MSHPTHPPPLARRRDSEPQRTSATYHSSFPSRVAALAAVGLFAVGVAWGTFAAGGSDSSCYLNQARLFRSGTTHIEQPLILTAPWPRAERTFTPAGHVPSPVRRDFIVPICPPGLPLLMAGAGLIPLGEFLVVPLCGAMAVWLTFVLGRRIESARVGAAAAVLIACSPAVLYQVVQPMTDVPAMAWWLLAAVLAIGPRDGESRPLAAGLAASMAVLTRPNLVPLAAVIGLYVAQGFLTADALAKAVSPATAALKRCATFLTGLAPGLMVLAILQTLMYGSPIATGYGPAGALFHTENVLPNIRLYATWILETHTSLILLAAAAPLVAKRQIDIWFGLVFAAATLALYLPYRQFDHWSYIRFLLPALPWLIISSLMVIDRLASRFIAARSGAMLATVVVLLGVFWIGVARQRFAFELVHLERHFVDAGTYVADHLADRTAILTVRHSGSVHYYARRPTVLWDMLEPGSLDGALEFLRSQNLRPILLLDTLEESTFRARFEGASAIGRLDWPPIARVGRTIRVYDPADRAPYFSRPVRNLSTEPPVQLPVWETSATQSVRFASSRSSPPSRSSR